MTLKDRQCDGKNCDHYFTEGEDYIYYKNDPESIYCTRECAMSWCEDPFRYGVIHFSEE
jgi:hypothetical protein